MRAVTKMPRRNALNGLFVTFSMARFKAPEEFSFSESPIRRMPYRNMANPPRREITSNISIKSPCDLSLFSLRFLLQYMSLEHIRQFT